MINQYEQPVCYRSLLKSKPVRSKALREAAKDAYCMHCGLPGDTGKVVLAHMPMYDAGMGQKCSDFFGIYLCDEHHKYMDTEGRDDFEFRLLNYRKQIAYWHKEKLCLFPD